MGHNHVLLGNPKSIGIPQVDGLSTGPPNLGRHNVGASENKGEQLAVMASVLMD